VIKSEGATVLNIPDKLLFTRGVWCQNKVLKRNVKVLKMWFYGVTVNDLEWQQHSISGAKEKTNRMYNNGIGERG
jgi:hypothetical protein